MDTSVAYLFAIIFFVVALNIYFTLARMRRGNRGKKNRVAVDEAKQKIWRDREVLRRIEREQDGALERVKLRNETLALYEEVRRRHAKTDAREDPDLGTYEVQNEIESDDLYSDDMDPFDIFKKRK